MPTPRIGSEEPVSIYGVDTVANRFRLLGMRSRKVPPQVWASIGTRFSQMVNTQFETQGAYFGTPWLKLNSKWLAWKIKHNQDPRILHQTRGAGVSKSRVGPRPFRHTLTHRPMQIERYYKRTASYGTKSKLAVWHHNGVVGSGRNRNTNIAPRPIFFVTPMVEEVVSDRLSKWINNGE